MVSRIARFGRPAGLWRHADFVRFWGADTISWIGSQVSLLAFPLIAVLTLDASAFEVGALAAAEQAPLFLIGLVAGAWVERRKKRSILIAADLGRAALLLAIPIAAFADALSIGLLYVVAFLVGTLSVFFDVSYLSYLPALVGKERLVEANSKLEASASSAQVVGPFLGGVLVGVLTAPFAMLVDALSFFWSALLLRRIRTPEPEPPRPAIHAGIWSEIGDGLRFVVRHQTLRALAGCAAVTNLFGGAFLAVYILYMDRELGLGATAIGLIFATGGVGALIGALVAGRIAARIGTGWTLIFAQLGFGLTGLLIPLAMFVPAVALPLVVASEFLQWLTLIVYVVNAISLRQSLTPDSLQGRVNATFTFLARGMSPVGALLGGALGGLIGLPMTLVVGEIGMFLAVGWLLVSPLRTAAERAEESEVVVLPASA